MPSNVYSPFASVSTLATLVVAQPPQCKSTCTPGMPGSPGSRIPLAWAEPAPSATHPTDSGFGSGPSGNEHKSCQTIPLMDADAGGVTPQNPAVFRTKLRVDENGPTVAPTFGATRQ